mmetsp:Transcript_31418/g.64733  ORF Transcript_31418/g.64733 Transcript_31418/m.64733 type:complete len:312 (-) Transcript_31418:1466-2401(-)
MPNFHFQPNFIPITLFTNRTSCFKRRPSTNPSNIFHFELAPSPGKIFFIVSIRNVHDIPRLILRHNVPRTTCRCQRSHDFTNPLSLSDRMIPQTIVSTDDISIRCIDYISGSIAEVRCEEIVEFHFAQEAQPLRVRTISIRQFELHGKISHFRFVILTQWEYDFRELLLSQCAKEVGLIFHRIGCSKKSLFLHISSIGVVFTLIKLFAHDITILQTSIMSRSNVIKLHTILLDPLQKTPELHPRITHNIRIRSPTPLGLLNRIPHHPLPIFLPQTDRFESDAHSAVDILGMLAYRLAYLQIVFPGTCPQVG